MSKYVIAVNKFKQNKEKFDDAWVDNKLKQGESLTLEFKERIFCA